MARIALIISAVLLTILSVDIAFAEECTLVCAPGLIADYNRCTCLPIRRPPIAIHEPLDSDENNQPTSGVGSGSGDRGGRGGCFLTCADNLYADYDKCTCFPKKE